MWGADGSNFLKVIERRKPYSAFKALVSEKTPIPKKALTVTIYL